MRGYVRVFLLFRRPSSQQCPAKGDGGYWLVRVLPCQRGRGLLARIHPHPSQKGQSLLAVLQRPPQHPCSEPAAPEGNDRLAGNVSSARGRTEHAIRYFASPDSSAESGFLRNERMSAAITEPAMSATRYITGLPMTAMTQAPP